MTWDEGLRAAEGLLKQEANPEDPELAIDMENIREKDGWLIVPYNGVTYLETRDEEERLLDCWPIIVNLRTGHAKMTTIEDRPFLKR
ncbi:YrhB domain-containing protein [Streptomyces sp. NPDC006990]|uniref:YrhB domain-containing protein n=1 Tax=unclassified Streptomyces TaxID=2593676 RepID=UPI003451A4DC